MTDPKREVISPVVIGGRQLLLIQEGTNGTATFHLGDPSQKDFLGNPVVTKVVLYGDPDSYGPAPTGDTAPSAHELLQVLGRAMKEAVTRREAARDRVRGGEVGDV